jgi:uncharacterized protein YkwD
MSIRSLALALLICFALPTAAALAQSGDPVLDSEEKAMCKQINAYRAQNKLPALKVSVSLTKAATWLSGDMARNDYLDHTDSLGRTYAKRIASFGYKGSAKGENIAAGSATASATFAQWKNSAPHRANMLSKTYKVIGIARASKAGSMFGSYWTTDFGNSTDRTMAC